MKAIWSTCARAFSLPGLGKKRGRADDISQEGDVLPESKKPKMGQTNDGKSTDCTDIYSYADSKQLNLEWYLSHN